MVLIDLVLTVFIAKTLFFAFGVFRSRRIGSLSFPDNSLTVSVIIPARDEAENLPACLESLMKQKAEFCEFIIVNDRSSDETQAVIDAFAMRDNRIKSIQLTEERSDNLRGKPGAIHAGIMASSGDIIMMSDADCTFPDGWIQKVTCYFGNEAVAMIAGFTTIRAESLFHHMQDMEWLMNHTLASAGVALGMPLGCFGNNLSIRASVYREVGGYPGIPFSVTEDLLLLQSIAHGGYTILYPINGENAVSTLPCKDWKGFVSQQHRWVRGSDALGWKKLLFVFFAIIFWGSLLFTIIQGDYIGAVSIVGMRILGDCFLILPALTAIKRVKQLPWIIPGMIFMMFIEIMVAMLLLKRDVHWKGQTFR
ncbi:MAG: glycosyltransferase [Ignavibacteria bacterium]|nr:glycosyltransferase [Ignavibacteria bacterium]